jgi:hypothetical protein
MSLIREPKIKTFTVQDVETPYKVNIEDHPIVNIATENLSHELVLNPLWENFNSYIASNVKDFIACAVDVRNSLHKTGKLTLTKELVESSLQQLMRGHKINIVTRENEKGGCCGWITDDLDTMEVFIDKLAFQKNYEEVFNTLFLSYGLDLEHHL